jgi:hypothetical protein
MTEDDIKATSEDIEICDFDLDYNNMDGETAEENATLVVSSTDSPNVPSTNSPNDSYTVSHNDSSPLVSNS